MNFKSVSKSRSAEISPSLVYARPRQTRAVSTICGCPSDAIRSLACVAFSFVCTAITWHWAERQERHNVTSQPRVVILTNSCTIDTVIELLWWLNTALRRASSRSISTQSCHLDHARLIIHSGCTAAGSDLAAATAVGRLVFTIVLAVSLQRTPGSEC